MKLNKSTYTLTKLNSLKRTYLLDNKPNYYSVKNRKRIVFVLCNIMLRIVIVQNKQTSRVGCDLIFS